MLKTATKRALEIGAKAVILATAWGWSRAEFGRRLGVSRAQLLRWEKGLEEPSNQKLVTLGNLAEEALHPPPIDAPPISQERAEAIRQMRKYPDSQWFWERAGLNLEAVRGSVWQTLTERDPSAGGKVVRVPRLDTAALLEFVKRGSVDAKPLATDLIPFPTMFISEPASTICVQATDTVAGSPFFAGDLYLVRLAAVKRGGANAQDLPDRSFENLIGCSVAVFYANSPTARELSPEAVRRRPRGRLFTEADRREIEVNRARNPVAYAEADRKSEELLEKVVATVESGVLFGSLRVQSHENWDGDFNRLKGDHPWRLVLDCGDIWNGLTAWSTEAFPWDGTLRSRLNSGVHILGAVIGWLRAPGGIAKV